MRGWRGFQPVVVGSAIALIAMVVAPFTIVGSAFAQPRESKASEPIAVLMRWKFLPREDINIESTSATTVVDDQGRQLQKTEQIMSCRWQVDSLGKDGTANITVQFERVRFRSESPAFEYDSSTDSPTATARWGRLLYEQRALSHAQLALQVNERGGVERMLGADSINAPMMYTPGDWPALPSQAVRVGDTWSVDAGSGSGDSRRLALTTYTLTHIEQAGERLVCHIAGTQVSQMSTDGADAISLTSISRFDVESGRFTEETIESKVTVESTPGQPVNVHSRATRRIARAEDRVVQAEKPGEYLFYFEAGDAHPIIVAGKRLGSPAKSVNRLLHVVVHHDWTDIDQDGQPQFDELAGVTTRFTAEADVRLAVYAFGLGDAKLDVLVIGSDGYLGRYPIPIEGNAAVALREFSGLAPGVYFFEFSVNDKHVVRVPIQVVGGDVRASPAASVKS